MKNYLDLYSVPVNFTYHKFYLYPSIWGGIFSLILELLLLAYLVFLLYDMSEREFPELAIHTKYTPFPNKIKILKDDTLNDFNSTPKDVPGNKDNEETYWYASIGIKEDGGLINIDESAFSINVKQMTINKDGKLTTSKSISVENCQSFGDDFVSEKQFNDLKLFNTKCINEEYQLEGLYGFINSSWLEIEISCDHCDSNNLQGKSYQVEFYYQSRNLDLTQFTDDVVVSVLEQVYWDILPKHLKVSNLKVSLDRILTNDYFLPRFIVRKYKEKYIFNTKSWSEQIKSNLNNANQNNTVLILRIIPDIISTTTERAFDDILTQLAMIGGLAGVVFPVGFLFVYSIRNFRMSENMMNDCYYIIDPKKKGKIKDFDQFIINHYKKLLSISGSKSKKDNKKKQLQEEQHMNEKIISSEENNFEHLNSDKQKIVARKQIINKYLKESGLEDNEGITSSSFNPCERFFTLKRIENLYGITTTQRSKPNNNNDLSQILNKEKANQIKYICYKFIYDSSIYKSQPDFSFNICEMFGYFFFVMCCCKRKKQIFKLESPENQKETKEVGKHNKLASEVKTSDENMISNSTDSIQLDNKEIKAINQESLMEKKYAVYYGANKKLGVDFDLINILKSREGFDYYTRVYFEKYQRNLFYSASKPTIKENDIGDDDEADEEKEEQEYKDMIQVYKNLLKMMISFEGNLDNYQKKLLFLMGRSNDDINMFENVIKNIENEESNHKNSKKLINNDSNNQDILNHNEINGEISPRNLIQSDQINEIDNNRQNEE